MQLTNADAFKRALVDLLVAETGVAEALYQVQVDYVDPAQDGGREVIYPGAATWSNDGDEWTRVETVDIPLYILVIDPGADPRATDIRAKALGAAVQAALAANPKPLGQQSWWAVVAGELAPSRTGDESRSLLTLSIEAKSYL